MKSVETLAALGESDLITVLVVLAIIALLVWITRWVR
jgi:hypothetical protein